MWGLIQLSEQTRLCVTLTYAPSLGIIIENCVEVGGGWWTMVETSPNKTTTSRVGLICSNTNSKETIFIYSFLIQCVEGRV